MKEEIITTIKAAIKLVQEFESSLTSLYKLSDIPYNMAGRTFARNGTIPLNGNEIKYHFHGSGCRLELNSAILEYGISPLTENNIKITPRNLQVFMKTMGVICPDEKNDPKYFYGVFKSLEEEGLLIKRPESKANYEVVINAFNDR